MSDSGYSLWINEERTVLLRMWHETGEFEVATRDDPGATWGPPVMLTEEPA